MESNRIRILILTPYYLPGYKAGGPIRSLANLVQTLGDYFDFQIMTADREFRSDELYKGINVNTWNRVGKARVFYCTPDKKSLRFFKKMIRETPHDILYLNSFFEASFTLIPLFLREIRNIPEKQTIIAPRGELSPGALAIKETKKSVFIEFAKKIGLYRNVIWHASNSYEESHIKKIFGDEVTVRKADNISSFYTENRVSSNFKTKGLLKILFLSRISYKKNLDGALKILKKVRGNIQFDIYGPIEDSVYWQKCQETISDLPENVKVEYKGMVPFEKVGEILSKYHLFFLPSKAENYGQVIFEALSAGCPVLISDQTPWRDLEKASAGYLFPLNEEEKFVQVIEKLISYEWKDYSHLKKGARTYAVNFQIRSESVTKYKALFDLDIQ
ncbi:MAG TPA: glycosyltransferase [Balneolales bacterium]|nr:glycosyltransferase [Balneolales bacterium]